MDDRHVFTVVMEPGVVIAAARKYMLRAVFLELNWTSVAVVFAVFDLAIVLATARRPDFTTGLMLGLAVAVFAAVGFQMWGIAGRMRVALSALKDSKATLRLRDDDFVIETEFSKMAVKWSGIRDLWKFEKVWFLLLRSGQAITLPLRDIPEEALRFIVSKAPSRPS